MEGANGAINSTLGCVEYLTLQIGDIPLKIPAHVVEHAPFQLLLGRPVQRILLSSLDEHPDGRVDIIARDPRDRSRRVIVPSRERRTHVGFVRTLAHEAVPPPPRMKALERYVTNSMRPDASRGPLVFAFAYNKAAKKVHPIAATLPEDFRIIRPPRRPTPFPPTSPHASTPVHERSFPALDSLKNASTTSRSTSTTSSGPKKSGSPNMSSSSMKRHSHGPMPNADAFGMTISHQSRSRPLHTRLGSTRTSPFRLVYLTRL